MTSLLVCHLDRPDKHQGNEYNNDNQDNQYKEYNQEYSSTDNSDNGVKEIYIQKKPRYYNKSKIDEINEYFFNE